MASEDDERRLWFRREVLPLEPFLRRYATRFRGGTLGEVDDLVHDTFAKLITYEGWRGVENVSAFAVRTMKNVFLQAARRSKIVPIHVMSDMDAMPIADEAADAYRVLEGRDQLRALVGLIQTLPPQCRRVFTLRKIYGLPNAEIADRLGLSISTVEKHTIKGLRLCSEGLARGLPRRPTDDALGIETTLWDESEQATKRRDGSSALRNRPATAIGVRSKRGAPRA